MSVKSLVTVCEIQLCILFFMLITLKEGRDLANRLGCQFIESSAKERINVDEAFYGLVKVIRRHNKVGVCVHEPR